MEPTRQLHQSYEFWFVNNNTRITVTFLGPHEWKYSGADHSYPHRQRRQWALSLVNAFPDAWRVLPTHEYIRTLEQRGFTYDEFMVQKQIQPMEFQIVCRSVRHL